MEEIVMRVFCDSTCGYLRGLRADDEIWLVAQDAAKGLGYGRHAKLPDGNTISVFQNDEFGTLRTVTIDGDTWFAGKDVAEMLGYREPQKAIRDHVDEEDRGVSKMDTPGGQQELAVINESGVYSMIIGSKLPEAKKFKRWVTSEVLPAIRRHGEYRTKATEEQRIAVEHFVTDGHRRFITQVELRDGLTKGLHMAGANRDPRRYIEDHEHGTITVKVDSAVDEMLQQFSPQGVTVIDLTGLRELAAPVEGEDAREYVAWVESDVVSELMETGAVRDCNMSGLTCGDKKAIRMYANKLAGDAKRSITCQKKNRSAKWSDRQLLNEISHRITDQVCNGDIRYGVNTMYKVISNELKIDWKQRLAGWQITNGNKKKKPTRADLLTKAEMPEAIAAVVRYCDLKNVDISDLLEKRSA